MSNYIESGHAKNTANFEHLIALLQTYGSNYNPSTASLALVNLSATLALSKTDLTAVKDKYNDWKNATNNREIAFEPLRSLSTRLFNTLLSCGVTEQTANDYKTINRKMQGRHSKLTKADSGKIINSEDANGATGEIKKTVSTSQRSFDNQIEHFDKIIKLLASESLFTTNENDLQVSTLQTRLTNLQILNLTAFNSYALLSNARITGNKTLYDEPNGLIYLARGIKAYIKGKFGADSPEYAQVSSIKFVRVVKSN